MAPAKLVFIDETGVTTNMIRRYGRAPSGQRLIGKTPHGHWKITTCIAALTSAGISALGTFDGAMNGELFLAWIVQFFVPMLAFLSDGLEQHVSRDAEDVHASDDRPSNV